MPELPEVETVVRDLRPRIVGAEISAARSSWSRTLRTHDPEAFDAAVRGRRSRGGEPAGQAARDRALGRGGPDDPPEDDRASCSSLPPPPPRTPTSGSSWPSPMAGSCASGTSGKFGRVGLYERDPGDRRAGQRAGRQRRLRRPSGPSRSIRPSAWPSSGAACARARAGSSRSCSTSRSSPGSATSTPTRRSGPRASIPLRSAASLRPADERRLYLAIRSILAEAIERRGSSIDDYTAPDGDGEMQERLQVYQRTGEPCPRCGRPIRRIVIGARATHFCSWCQRLPAADRRALERSGGIRILRAMTGGRAVVADPGVAATTLRTKTAAATRRAAARSSAAAGAG